MKRVGFLLLIFILSGSTNNVGAALSSYATALHRAADKGDVREVERLVNANSSSEYLNSLSDDGFNALHFAQFQKQGLKSIYWDACKKYGQQKIDELIERYEAIESYLKSMGALQYPTPPSEAPTRPSSPVEGEAGGDERKEMTAVVQEVMERFEQKQKRQQSVGGGRKLKRRRSVPGSSSDYVRRKVEQGAEEERKRKRRKRSSNSRQVLSVNRTGGSRLTRLPSYKDLGGGLNS